MILFRHIPDWLVYLLFGKASMTLVMLSFY